MTQPILIFMDLDDTLFQTKRKNPAGEFIATQGSTLSYMSKAQQQLLMLLQQNKQSLIIPCTARDKRQYENTLISQQTALASIYYGAMILQDGQPHPAWQSHICKQYEQLTPTIQDLYRDAQQYLQGEEIKLFNVDDYYLSIKAGADYATDKRDSLFNILKSSLDYAKHFEIHQNGRALSFLPKFINKSYAVQFLIDYYQPELTIGIGDNRHDYSFMQCCHFQMHPHSSDISYLLNTTID